MVSLRTLVPRRVSVNSPKCTFHSVVKLGPDLMHLFCQCTMYRKSVALCNKAHYTKIDEDLLNNVFSAGISCKCSYCRVSTVASVHV